MQTLVTGAWLWGYPVDIAIVNLGGLRAPLPAGEVTLADVVGVLPFDNVLIEVELTGTEVLRVLAGGGRPATVNGIHFVGGSWLLDATGEPMDPDAVYSVLVPDFLYAGGDGYGLIAELDPDAYDTGIHWRQPVIDWIEAQASTPEEPLDDAIKELEK
jgi:2',3'-cyclic-nucleotide 2'-phosphodiesterase (5'-nucleotidase family)